MRLGGLEPWGVFQYQKISLPKISLPKMSFGLVQSGWGESECFCKNLAPGSCEVFKDIFRAYRNAPQKAKRQRMVSYRPEGYKSREAKQRRGSEAKKP